MKVGECEKIVMVIDTHEWWRIWITIHTLCENVCKTLYTKGIYRACRTHWNGEKLVNKHKTVNESGKYFVGVGEGEISIQYLCHSWQNRSVYQYISSHRHPKTTRKILLLGLPQVTKITLPIAPFFSFYSHLL